ncbi:UCHL3 [Symbiodinium necroappetens]|uniref:Ubiquitin carboxyl-terminal hydrolase n=1 Tax=Symbiodinium necroappetens TaxID=1628268 RepID=A0A812NWE8_9DINO|nr:UCHL3 [Symbiodinium necroappetens]
MASAPASDDLAVLNDQLRKQGNSGAGPWLALESNPAVFTEFSQRIGLPARWQFCDVLGLDKELLGMVPRPVAACVLLFPCSERIYAARREQDAALRAGGSLRGASPCHDDGVFFLKQVIGFGNACGTVACLHATSNARDWMSLAQDAPLERFVQLQASSTPEQRGEALLNDASLRQSSETAATSEAAQTQCPDRHGPPLDHHFAAFARSRQNRIIELDGTKRGPVDHGPTSEASFLEDVAAAVKRNFMDVEPDLLDFSLLALAANTES